jgi:hypothetical protein
MPAHNRCVNDNGRERAEYSAGPVNSEAPSHVVQGIAGIATQKQAARYPAGRRSLVE